MKGRSSSLTVVVAALFAAVLVSQVALAGGGGGKQLQKLKQRLGAVERELAAIKAKPETPAPPLANDVVGPANLLPFGTGLSNGQPIQGVPFVVKAVMFTGAIDAGAQGSLTFYNANAPVDFRIIDAWTVKGASGSEPFIWRLRQGAGGPEATSYVPVGTDEGDISRMERFDPASDQTIPAGGSLTVQVTNTGAVTDSLFQTVYVLAIPFNANP